MSSRPKKHTSSSINESNIPLERRAAWEQEFLSHCSCDEVARRAWEKLQAVGLANVSKEVLWNYGSGEKPFAQVQKAMGNTIHNLRAVVRAQRVAKSRSRDQRAKMFSERCERVIDAALGTQWPFFNSDIRTFRDAALKYDGIGTLSAGEAPALLAKDRDSIRRSGLRFWLIILQLGARAHAVNLSPNSLATLAYCSNPHHDVDKRSLRRLLKGNWIRRAAPGYLSWFEEVNKRMDR